MGPHVQLSGGNGCCGALHLVNVSMLAPGRELFLERDSLLADFPPLGVAGGSSCWGPCRLPASLSLWKKGVCGISPNQKHVQPMT